MGNACGGGSSKSTTTHIVSVRTGDKKGAGTDGNVRKKPTPTKLNHALYSKVTCKLPEILNHMLTFYILAETMHFVYCRYF